MCHAFDRDIFMSFRSILRLFHVMLFTLLIIIVNKKDLIEQCDDAPRLEFLHFLIQVIFKSMVTLVSFSFFPPSSRLKAVSPPTHEIEGRLRNPNFFADMRFC